MAIVVWLAFIWWAWSQVPANGENKNQPSETSDAGPYISAPGLSGENRQNKSAKQKQCPDPKPSDYPWREFIFPTNVPNEVLAIAGIIGIFVAVWTLRTIRRQANIMDAQAKDAKASAAQTFEILKEQTDNLLISAKAATMSAAAASESAHAFMEGDRAWVTASIHQPNPEDMNIRGKAENWGLAVGLIFKNLGKTPSTITDSYVRYDFAPSINTNAVPILPSLPPEPDYSVEKERGVIVAPGTVWMPRQKFDFCMVILKHDFAEHLKEWEVSEKILCVYGFIDYLDAYKRSHTTRFCYAYLKIRAPLALMNEASGKMLFPPKFCLAGPEPYNRIT